ncbi:hypothetical protein McanCB49686_006876 [Microsporum canis]
MRARSGQSGPSRKRRRQTIVCTECRRRKIACDRNAPCTQCIQSKAACTYYSSCSSGGRFSIDNDGSIMSSPHVSQPEPGARAPLPVSTVAGHHRGGLINTIDVGAEDLYPPTPLLLDPGASASWLDPAELDEISLPFGLPVEPGNNNATFCLDPSIIGTHTLETSLDIIEGTANSSGSSSNASSGQESPKKLWLYGPSHWMTLCQKYEKQGLFDDINDAVFGGEGHPILQKCKQLGRTLKTTGRPNPKLLSQPLTRFIPSRETADRLVQLYLRTFESVFRVLHVPTFKQEYEQYWDDPQAASESFVLLLLLVMAIGTCFYQDLCLSDGANDGTTLHERSTQWIFAAHMRLVVPFRKRNLNIRGVQLQCLLVLALLTNTSTVGGDLFWITTASLVQSAMAVGLHIKPVEFAIGPLEAEIRRRLWATVLELVVQASLDSGVDPIISAEALESCELPSNLDDCQISKSTEILPESKPTGCFTQNSIQCALMRSLPIRLKITETLSRFHAKLQYEVARQMGAELTAILRETSDLIDSFTTTQPSVFQVQLQDLLARRFLLVLHGQFAHKASSDVNYYYSRTVCLESSQLLLAALHTHGSNKPYGGQDANTVPSVQEDCINLLVYGDGIFKNVFLAAVITVCAEYLTQLRDDSSPAASSLSRRELLQSIEDGAALTRRRILMGETSVKAHVFLACVLAKAGGSRRRGQHRGATTRPRVDQVVAETAQRTLDSCYRVLEDRISCTTARGEQGLDLVVSSNRINSPGSAFSKGTNNNRPERPNEKASDTNSLLDCGLDAWSNQLANIDEGWFHQTL